MTVAAVILAICIFIWFPFRSTTALKVTFACSTNDMALGHLAVFSATNESDFDAWFVPCPPQIKTHGAWGALKHNYGVSGTDVPAHTARTFAVSFVTNCESWRMPVDWFYKYPNPIEDFRGQMEANAYWNWNRLSRGQWPKYFNRSYGVMGNGHMACSAEVME